MDASFASRYIPYVVLPPPVTTSTNPPTVASSSTPQATISAVPVAEVSGPKHSSVGAIAGGVVGGVIVILAIVALLVFLARRRGGQQRPTVARGASGFDDPRAGYDEPKDDAAYHHAYQPSTILHSAPPVDPAPIMQMPAAPAPYAYSQATSTPPMSPLTSNNTTGRPLPDAPSPSYYESVSVSAPSPEPRNASSMDVVQQLLDRGVPTAEITSMIRMMSGGSGSGAGAYDAPPPPTNSSDGGRVTRGPFPDEKAGLRTSN